MIRLVLAVFSILRVWLDKRDFLQPLLYYGPDHVWARDRESRIIDLKTSTSESTIMLNRVTLRQIRVISLSGIRYARVPATLRTPEYFQDRYRCELKHPRIRTTLLAVARNICITTVSRTQNHVHSLACSIPMVICTLNGSQTWECTLESMDHGPDNTRRVTFYVRHSGIFFYTYFKAQRKCGGLKFSN